jgi:hypothetical protein
MTKDEALKLVQEPVAWMDKDGDLITNNTHEKFGGGKVALCKCLCATPSPAAQPAVPLTDEQRMELWRTTEFRGNGGQIDWFIEGTRAAEAAHGITAAAPEKGQKE